MQPVETLQDFALNLLRDADAMSAFDSDPTGVLQAANLGDVTAQDIHEILPLVADYAPAQDFGDIGSPLDVVNELDAVGLSDVESNLGNLAGTTAIAENLIGDVGLGQAVDTSVLDQVTNSGDLLQDVTGAGVGDTGIDAVDDLTSKVGDVTGGVDAGGLDVSDGLDLHSAVDDTVGDLTGNLSGNLTDNLTDNPITTALHDVGNADLTGNLSNLHNVVGDIGLNGDVTDVVGGIDIGGLDIGGIGNDLEF